LAIAGKTTAGAGATIPQNAESALTQIECASERGSRREPTPRDRALAAACHRTGRPATRRDPVIRRASLDRQNVLGAERIES
jgi:hypothetical protein